MNTQTSQSAQLPKTIPTDPVELAALIAVHPLNSTGDDLLNRLITQEGRAKAYRYLGSAIDYAEYEATAEGLDAVRAALDDGDAEAVAAAVATVRAGLSPQYAPAWTEAEENLYALVDVDVDEGKALAEAFTTVRALLADLEDE
ncbi:hypothetical protein [Natronoglycomyces albus]|uniref:Uncharacterized protein n=1 Tax=Natronoglycomyces albus TaxID=2811108 RepID=A0A895XUQ4_9ACTN|nr:hypothetical protein [Natronoglycomyces albus]QSB07193.1 hypothetical protein JQS30_16955 [Natronoglycomyces albus]